LSVLIVQWAVPKLTRRKGQGGVLRKLSSFFFAIVALNKLSTLILPEYLQ